ncbi:hypothetical protein H8959_012959, partial [Pygathrix nigripes]
MAAKMKALPFACPSPARLGPPTHLRPPAQGWRMCGVGGTAPPSTVPNRILLPAFRISRLMAPDLQTEKRHEEDLAKSEVKRRAGFEKAEVGRSKWGFQHWPEFCFLRHREFCEEQ